MYCMQTLGYMMDDLKCLFERTEKAGLVMNLTKSKINFINLQSKESLEVTNFKEMTKIFSFLLLLFV